VKVTLLSPALREILDAIEYYEGQRVGLGTALDDDLTDTLRLIARHPSAGTPHERGTRRALLGGFPYDVIYLALDDRVVVVAFAHQHRRPGYWENRV
jgi:toxin ParE2